MIEIEMSADVRDYEPQIFGPLTGRQIICCGIGIILGLPPLFLLTFLPIEYRIVFSVVLAAPAIACGFVKLYGMNLEVFFLNVFVPSYLNPAKRRYQSENKMEVLLEEPVKKNRKIKYTKNHRPLK